MFQQFDVVKGINQAKCEERGQKVAELTANNGLIVMYTGILG